MQKKVFLVVLVLVLLGGGYYATKKFISRDTETPELGEPVHYESTHVKYFSDKLQEHVRETLGRPIEGYTPDMFEQVFPGFEPVDFDGVVAIGGTYRLNRDGTLRFEQADSALQTSADGSLETAGMETLLARSASRNMLVIVDNSTIDELIELLSPRR